MIQQPSPKTSLWLLIILFSTTIIFAEEYSSFNIDLSIPEDYKSVNPGNDVLISIKLTNLGSSGRSDVILEFQMVDAGNNVLLTKKETVAVETQASLVRSFTAPADAPEGQYFLKVKAIYAPDKEAISETDFEVKKPESDNSIIYLAVGMIILLVIIIFLIMKSRRWIDDIRMRMKIHRMVKDRMRKI